MQDLLENPAQYVDMAIDLGIRVLAALLIMIIGFWIIKTIVNWLDKLMQKRDLDKPLREFLARDNGQAYFLELLCKSHIVENLSHDGLVPSGAKVFVPSAEDASPECSHRLYF